MHSFIYTLYFLVVQVQNQVQNFQSRKTAFRSRSLQTRPPHRLTHILLSASEGLEPDPDVSEGNLSRTSVVRCPNLQPRPSHRLTNPSLPGSEGPEVPEQENLMTDQTGILV